MPSPKQQTWKDLFDGAADLPQEKLRWWLSDRLDCSLTELPLSSLPTEQEVDAFLDAVNRLRSGEPVQYICGRTPFRGLTLEVTPDVLIPRPETEQLVQLALDHVIQPKNRVLDVGTGSGCIALSLKQERPDLHIEGTDVSDSALQIAKRNAETHNLNVPFRQADLLKEEPPHSWDVILSNPPYIGESERGDLPKEVKEFEPQGALFSGEDGLDHIQKLLQQALLVLKPGGRILLETGETQGAELNKIAEELGYAVTHWKDLAGRERFRLLERVRPRA